MRRSIVTGVAILGIAALGAGCFGPRAPYDAAPQLPDAEASVVTWKDVAVGWGTGVRGVTLDGNTWGYGSFRVPAGRYEMFIEIVGTGPTPGRRGSPTLAFDVSLEGGRRYEARCYPPPRTFVKSDDPTRDLDMLCWLQESSTGEPVGEFKGYVTSRYDELHYDGEKTTRRSRPGTLVPGNVPWPPPPEFREAADLSVDSRNTEDATD